MRAIAFDTETCPIVPGLLAPPLVVVSMASVDRIGLCKDRQEAVDWFRLVLHPTVLSDITLVGHNIAYDMAVMAAHDPSLLPAIFAAYEDHRVHDTMINEQLFDIARGRQGSYSLETLAKTYLDRDLDKTRWRLGYGELLDTPIDQWPEGAHEYAKEDAKATYEIFQKQVLLDDDGGERWLEDAPRQAKYSFSIHLMCVWGIRTDPERVAALADSLQKEQIELAKILLEQGLMRQEKGKLVKNQKVLRARVTELGSSKVTGKGQVAIDRATLLATGDPDLRAYTEYVANEKLLSTYVPVLQEGTRVPINSSFRLVETGRRGATKNMQTPPKKEGVRECYVPRPGYVFCSCDYDTLELRALAQINLDLFGSSPLADLYRDDPNADPHTKFASEVFLGIDYAEGMRRKAAKDAELLALRQHAKAYNFGLPGGLGAARFVELAREQYGIEVTEQEAERDKARWIKTWRMRPFFDYVKHRVDFFGWLELPRSRRVRGGLSFCSAANYLFQGPAADGACYAHFLVSQACYTQRRSPLYGSRIVNFMHDELILEMLKDHAADAAQELDRLMCQGMAAFLPDISITTSPALMPRWSKKAQPVYVDGKLSW